MRFTLPRGLYRLPCERCYRPRCLCLGEPAGTVQPLGNPRETTCDDHALPAQPGCSAAQSTPAAGWRCRRFGQRWGTTTSSLRCAPGLPSGRVTSVRCGRSGPPPSESPIRVTPDRQLHSPSGRPAVAGSRGNIRALGTMLYLPLTGCWPLPMGHPACRARRRAGRLTDEPHGVATRAPVELSTLALRSISGPGTGGRHAHRVRAADAGAQALTADDFNQPTAAASVTVVSQSPGTVLEKPRWSAPPPSVQVATRSRCRSGRQRDTCWCRSLD